MDLDIVRVIKSIPKDYGPEELSPLVTPWGEALMGDEEAVPRAEHPRPQFARATVHVLHGWWDYAFVSCADAATAWASTAAPPAMDGRIRVPFSPEASLSGVNRQLQPQELLWYRRPLSRADFKGSGGADQRLILHFDGVDHACAVYLGGTLIGTHEGAYQPFSFDVTDELAAGETVLELCVYDPSETGTQLRGKQRIARSGMWYTAQSGIWQPVWTEVVPAVHVDSVRLDADPDAQELRVTAWLEGTAPLSVDILDAEGIKVATGGADPAEGVGVVSFAIPVAAPRLWSPDDPYLYQLRIRYGTDVVDSYCAFRCVAIEDDESGTKRLCLNHKPFFVRGLLDQGYWPDGLMTAPSDEALSFDLCFVRKAGFNMVRKHIKCESERWYWHADRLGILVWQDMPTGGDNPLDKYARDRPTLFRTTWHAMRDDTAKNQAKLGASDPAYRKAWTDNMAATISRLYNHPCVITWVLFNESWGQFDAALATQLAWEMDATRPVLSTSGWYDQGVGDYHAVHNYFRGMHMFKDPYAGRRKKGHRAQVVSEFGGLTWRIADHSQLDHTYGYAEFESMDAWREALDTMLAKMDALEAQGLSGYVYTQISDVEEETNGLLTYDRRVNKLA